MIAVVDGYIVVQRPGRRTIPIQPMNEMSYYAALLAFGIKDSVAAAAAKGLITVRIGVSA